MSLRLNAAPPIHFGKLYVDYKSAHEINLDQLDPKFRTALDDFTYNDHKLDLVVRKNEFETDYSITFRPEGEGSFEANGRRQEDLPLSLSEKQLQNYEEAREFSYRKSPIITATKKAGWQNLLKVMALGILNLPVVEKPSDRSGLRRHFKIDCDDNGTLTIAVDPADRADFEEKLAKLNEEQQLVDDWGKSINAQLQALK